MRQLICCLAGREPTAIAWSALIRDAMNERVAPSLHRSLVDMGAVSDDPQDLEFLAEVTALNRERNAHIWSMTCETTRVLNAAGITPTLIKGVARMSQLPEPASYERMLIDLDILVNADEVERACDALLRSGLYRIENSTYEHSPGSFHKDGYIAAIDLHASLPFSELWDLSDYEARLELVKRDGLEFKVPDAGLALLSSVVHDQLHHSGFASGRANLQYLIDIKEILDSEDPIDQLWLKKKLMHPKVAAAFALQMKCLALISQTSPPISLQTTFWTEIAYRRRLLKIYFPKLGELEWALIQPLRNVLRRLRRLRSVSAGFQRKGTFQW